MNEEKKQKFITLKFVVTGTPITVEKVNVKQPLKVAVQKALDGAGSTRPITDFNVFYQGNSLDISQKVETFSFPDGAVLQVSPKSGQGGF